MGLRRECYRVQTVGHSEGDAGGGALSLRAGNGAEKGAQIRNDSSVRREGSEGAR